MRQYSLMAFPRPSLPSYCRSPSPSLGSNYAGAAPRSPDLLPTALPRSQPKVRKILDTTRTPQPRRAAAPSIPSISRRRRPPAALRTETGEAGGNPEAGCRRGAKAWHPNCAGSLHPASGDAGAAEAVEPDVLPLQLWVSTASVGTPSRGAGAAVHRGWLRLGD